MTDAAIANPDAVRFYERIRTPHRRINPCFMTGKGCVHTEHIDSDLQHRTGSIVGFNVRPFQANIETAHRLSLNRFLQSNYATDDCRLILGEADKVRRTGYVVCEKICRRIQASDFVVVDVSAPNANVFYELGLAYGIDQKIIVIHHQRAKDETSKEGAFAQKAAAFLADGGCSCFAYTNLEPIRPEDFILSHRLWRREQLSPQQSNRPAPTIVLLSQSYGFLASANLSGETAAGKQPTTANDVDTVLGATDIPLTFETHVKAAVGVAIDNILRKLDKLPAGAIMKKYIDLVDGLRSTDQIKRDTGFQEVRQKIEQSFCTIIQTGGKVSDPAAYFWLGYCHALGKNVIPVTVVEKSNDAIDDLAFDLRALWHMSFARKEPIQFSQEIEETLQQMIATDFAEWSRRKFWDEVLGRRGKVSIFTGALHNPIGREMIGDWDLRSASELTSYFASHQYRVTIESPVYQIEQVTAAKKNQPADVSESDYIRELEQMLRGKNCIVIASPDVNPLTELLLGKLYGVDRQLWFKPGENAEKENGAVVAFKEVEVDDSNGRGDAEPADDDRRGAPEQTRVRAFYRKMPVPKSAKDTRMLKRGFIGHGVKGGSLPGAFLSQTDERSPFNVHAHLVVARNPFDEDALEPHHVIILNGVSGPATFALTHVLTGGTSTQFVAYPDLLPGTPPFSESDMKDEFAVDLRKHADQVSKFIWDQLDSAVRSQLEDLQGNLSEAPALRKSLTREVNSLIARASLYDEHRFAGVKLRSETKQLLSQNPQGKEVERLNRLLLEDAFPTRLWRSPFLPDSESEGFLQQLNQDLEMIKKRFLGVQYFFSVEVGPAHEEGRDGTSTTRRKDIFDWRRIVRWERTALTPECAFGHSSGSK